MHKIVKIVLVIIFTLLLVGIRLFEDKLFYDPLILFFKTDHTTHPLPQFDTLKLMSHIIFRFCLNSLLSLTILWIVFRDMDVIKLSVFLYSVLFIALFTAFYFLMFTSKAGEHLLLFYVRRFLIQPLLLLILLPAFYFQKKM